MHFLTQKRKVLTHNGYFIFWDREIAGEGEVTVPTTKYHEWCHYQLLLEPL